MSKLSKIFFIIGILLISFCCHSYAATASTTTTSSTAQTTNTQSTSNEKSSSNTNTTKLTSSQYSTDVTASNFDLQLTNILSICLIVFGVLLILLAIAILIRLRS